jgi:hypothetical protein
MYSDRPSVEIEPPRTSAGMRPCGGAASIWGAGGITVLLLVGAGIVYRIGAARLEEPAPILPPVSLAEIPVEVGGWISETLDIPSITEEYMRSNFADDYISRRYVNEQQRMWADAYVVYCSSRPAGMLGHQPMRCFPAHGWTHDGTSESEFESASGRQMKCLVHRFHKPAPDYHSVVVLSFYVLNGQVTLREGDFSGFFGRRPNISGNPARYVAQIQISSAVEHSARSLAAVLTDSVLAILPDRHGQVQWAVPQRDSSEPDTEAPLSN